MTTGSDVARLRRIQGGARATLALGIGASLTANVLAADPSLIGRLVAGWSPLALMLTVELLSRVPTCGGRLSRLRVIAASGIAGIAAWVSYWHMVEVSLAAGEATVAAHLLPLSVDGLVVVASICLVEITNRLNASARPTIRLAPARASATPRIGSGAQPTSPTTVGQASTHRPSPGAQRHSPGDLVRQLAAEHPGWTQAELAAAAGCSVRTVRRHVNDNTSGHRLDHEDPTSGAHSPGATHDQPAGPVAATSNGSAP